MIIDNMSKLVDDPVDARPLIPLLMPALEYAAETLCDPEARGCAGACYCWYTYMQALDAKVKSVVINDIDHEAVFGALKAKVPGVLWLQLERLHFVTWPIGSVPWVTSC